MYKLKVNRIACHFIFICLHYIIRYRRLVICKNLAIIYPNETKELIYYRYKGFHIHLSELILESIWAFGAKPDEIFPKVKFKNLDLFEEIYSNGQNATILISHIGNWELFCQWAALFIPKVKVNILYTPIKNKALNSLMIQLRERYGARLISTKSTLDLFRIQKSEGVAINLFAIDQNPGNPSGQHWMSLFGQKVPVISGAEKFARSQGQKAYYLYVRFNETYELELIELPYEQDIDFDLTSKQISILEKNILEDSSKWLLSHNRFKHQKHNF